MVDQPGPCDAGGWGFYAYPEGLAVAGLIFLAFFCHSVWSGIWRRGRAWRRYLISASLVLVLICWYAPEFSTALFGHLFGQALPRLLNGQIFPGLISPRFLPAIFGLARSIRVSSAQLMIWYCP